MQIICLLSRSRRQRFVFILILVDNPKGTFLNSIQGRVRSVRYVPSHTAGITDTGHFGKFSTSVPVPDNSTTSVRRQYRYRILG